MAGAPHIGRRALGVLTLVLLAVTVALVARASAQGGGSPACAATLIPGGTIGVPDGERAGPAAPLPSAWPASDRRLGIVYLRSTKRTYNRLYEFALDKGHLFAHVRRSKDPWRRVPLPACLAGNLVGISVDDDEMIAIDRGRQIYGMDNALKAPSQWNWSARWGPPVWTGTGWVMPPTDAWTWSVISAAEDETWTDPAGNHTPIGAGKVSHIWGLRNGGRQLTFWDPWLPKDNAYEMCGPYRSRFRAINISASGTRVFIIGPRGDMFTRLYDFDISGHDPVFFKYSYADQTGRGDGAPIQLPAEPWTQQPKIPGRITAAISISKKGVGAVHSILRVGGRKDGRNGFWQRDAAAPARKGWRFRPHNGPLVGKPIPNPARDTSKRNLGAAENHRYVMDQPGAQGEIANFNLYCSPARLVVSQGSGPSQLLTLHNIDALRQLPAARGLTDDPREQYGAIEYPDGHFEPVKVLATDETIEIQEKGWVFERAG